METRGDFSFKRILVLVGVFLAGLAPSISFGQGCCAVSSPSAGVLDQDPVSEGQASIGFSAVFRYELTLWKDPASIDSLFPAG